MKNALLLLCALIVPAAVAVLLTGCEQGDVSGATFRIEPSDVTLSASNRTAVLAVVGGIPPFTWSVSDKTRGDVTGGRDPLPPTPTNTTGNASNVWTVAARSGSILAGLAGGGVAVTYTRTGLNGINVVEARDSRGWLAAAMVRQVSEPGAVAALAVTPASPSIAADGSSIALKVDGGTAPFAWAVVDAALGHLVTVVNGGRDAVYMRDHAGQSVLTVTDSLGAAAVVMVSQP